MTGLIVKKLANRFWVCSNDNEFECVCRGNLKTDGLFVGDKVEFSVIDNSENVIENLLERKNLLIRPPLANLDKLFVVIAQKPKPDLLMVDKLILFARVYGIEPILVINKVDNKEVQGDINEIVNCYKSTIKTFCVSAHTCYNIDELKNLLSNSVSAFAGQSAVGKSSLINAICDAGCEIGSFAKKVERGKHTTRHCELFRISKDSFLADTPGFTFLDEKLLPIKYDEVKNYYPEFVCEQSACNYKNSCMHINEAQSSCKIKQLVASKKLDKNRYERYTIIYQGLLDRWRNDYE